MNTHGGIPRTIGASRYRERGRRGNAPGRTLRPLEIAVFAAIALALAGASCLPTPADGAPAPTSTKAVRVESCDSLWSIARDNAVEGESTAATVRRIRRLNGLDGSTQLQAGTFVLVPRADVGTTALARR